MSVYPAAFRVSFLYTVCVSIVTSTIGLVVEKNNPSVWIIHFDITLITIVTMVCYIYIYILKISKYLLFDLNTFLKIKYFRQ